MRPMGAGDISAAAAIEATVPDGWSGQAIAEYAAMPAARCFVAVSGQQVCGFAALPVPRARQFGRVKRGGARPAAMARPVPCWAAPFRRCAPRGRNVCFWKCAPKTRLHALCTIRSGLYKQEFEKGFIQIRKTTPF